MNSDGNLVIGKCTAVGTSRHFKIGIDGSYNFCIGDYAGDNTAWTWLNTQFNINYSTGNVGIGVAPSSTYKLNVNGSINSTTEMALYFIIIYLIIMDEITKHTQILIVQLNLVIII